MQLYSSYKSTKTKTAAAATAAKVLPAKKKKKNNSTRVCYTMYNFWSPKTKVHKLRGDLVVWEREKGGV